MADTALLVVGASARAAAQSAQRAGFVVAAVDLFGDADLNCPAWRAEEYPRGLVDAAEQAPPGAWLYTGGLENYPELVQAISERRELLGNGPETLRRVRDPQLLAEACRHGGLCAPHVLSDQPRRGTWLLKPRASGGGRGIRSFSSLPYPKADHAHYWQEFQPGAAQSAVYLAHDAECRLLGVTEQLIETEWAGASGFCYAGSIGPLGVEAQVREQYERIGHVFSQAFSLRGLFGVDTVLSDDGELFVIELNPRYTASVELLERAFDIALIAEHVAACRGVPWQTTSEAPEGCGEQGKAVLYARHDYLVSPEFTAWCCEQNYADIPRPATTIERGQPVVTLFATGGCTESVRHNLRRLAEKTFVRLEPCRVTTAIA